MSSKELKKRQGEALQYIRNSFAHRGKAPSVREIMRTLGYKSPRSAALVIESLLNKGVITKRPDGRIRLASDREGTPADIHTVGVPLIGYVACGAPILAEQNIEAVVPVSRRLLGSSQKYFLLRADGDSMNQAKIKINHGDVVLVRQQHTANEGEMVVALINDSATIKEFHRTDGAVILNPRSDNTDHQPIVVTDDVRVQGVVVSTLGHIGQEY